MKAIFPLFILLVAFSCSKAKKVERKLEGKWLNNRILNNDGSESYPADRYEFKAGDADGKSYLPLTFFGSDTTQGSYLIYDKGRYLILIRNSNFPNDADTCKIEDIGKTTMVIRDVEGALFLIKE